MIAYAIRRILLMIPTLFAIMVVNFFIIQAAPGGPVQQMIAKLRGNTVSATERVSGGQGDVAQGAQAGGDTQYRGARGIDPALIKQLVHQYGFDKPPLERFALMMKNYVRFDFGNSFFQDRSVVSLICDKLPVSISIGLWTTLFTYLVSIPLGIRKAVKDGSGFDVWTSTVIIVGYAVPSFLFAVLLIVLFAGGSYFSLFPLRGLVSDNWASLSWPMRIVDYFWHIALPILSLVIGSFATLTMLTKNCFLDEINKQYVLTARAKGLTERRVLYGHVFRNAMLLVVASFPATLVSILFTGSLLIEVIFSLDGLGLLGFEAAINRDYPIMFATLYVFTLIGLVLKLVSDLTYMLIDPRIDFATRGA
ncbi:MAG: microcin C ABC transporter permease YejB [Alphaproteobacteria bacterium]|nr:microcin C ABC transporter permease YejB [Alphaproteobacteria bacterium]MBV9553814.1 microcin C ABC transporter permease YejB [Alphaproteobacteria bacterium]